MKPSSRSLLETRGVDGLRVGFGGHLGIGREPEMVMHRRDQPTKIIRRQYRRRATADEDGRDLARPVPVLEPPDELVNRGVNVAGAAGSRLGAEFGGGIGVEVAIAATCRAERDMDIDAEGSQRRARTVPARAASHHWAQAVPQARPTAFLEASAVPDRFHGNFTPAEPAPPQLRVNRANGFRWSEVSRVWRDTSLSSRLRRRGAPPDDLVVVVPGA